MKCKKYQKYLHLNKTGELTPNQQKNLTHHLTFCRFCQQEKRDIKNADRIIQKLLFTNPYFSKPELSLAHIMNHIQNRSDDKSSLKWLYPIFNFQDLVFSNGFRLFMAGTLFLIMTSFLYQESVLLHRQIRLEYKMRMAAKTHRSPEMILTEKVRKRLKDPSLIKDSQNILSIFKDQSIFINKQDLSVLLVSFNTSKTIQKQLLSTALNRYPTLKPLILHFGINRNELNSLPFKKEKILTDISRP